MNTAEIGLLVLRFGVAGLFLYTGWTCGRNAGARLWTINETAILVPSHAKLCGLTGIAMMILGGLLVLLGGRSGQVGGAVLTLFLLGGTIIHLRQMKRVDQLALSAAGNQASAGGTPLEDLRISARLAHFSSALKNLCLMTVTVFIALAGTGTRFNILP